MAHQSSKKLSANAGDKSYDASNELAEPSISNSDPDDNHFSQLVNEWLMKNKISAKMNYLVILEQVALGLEIEGRLVEKKDEGARLAKMLREVKDAEKKETIARCILL